MTDWMVELIPGGLVWSTDLSGTDQRRQVSVFIANDGYWHVTSYRTGEGVFSKASFNSRSKTSEGLERCLAWARMLLDSNNEAIFDIEAAKRLLLEHQPPPD